MRHYDEAGLVRPSGRTQAGHRGDALFAEFHGGDPDLVALASEAWRSADPAELSRGAMTAESWSSYLVVQAARA